jgi:hypothetical protein
MAASSICKAFAKHRNAMMNTSTEGLPFQPAEWRQFLLNGAI